MNLHIISLQDQLDLACELARQDPATRTAIVCTIVQFNFLIPNLGDGEEFSSTTKRIKFPNGAEVFWLSSQPERLADYSGHQLTTLFIAQEVRGDVILSLQSRLRSSRFKGPLKTYYSYGFVMWEEWETYGR